MSQIKTLLEELGKQLDVTITHGETTYTSDSVVSCNIETDGTLLTSCMRQATIELDDVGGEDFAQSIKGEEIQISLTVTVDESTATKNFGTFIVKDAEYNDEYNSVTLTCYDLMLNAMKRYNPFADFSQTVTLGDYLQGLCNEIGVTLGTPTFTNSTVELDGEKYDNQYTYRDVLTEIAQAAGGTIAIKNGELCVLYPTETNETVDPSNLRSITVEEQYTINSVVLARTPQEDNIFRRDETATSWQEIKIENNPLMDSHRDDFIDGIYDSLNGLSFYPYEIESFGIGCLDICDRFTLETLDEEEHSTIYMGGSIEIGQGMKETATLSLPGTTETDYKAADTTERRINQTILRVDKQERRIEAFVSETIPQLNQATGDIEDLKQSVAATITAEQAEIIVQREIQNIDSVTTATGYTFGADGLRIKKTGEEMENLLDNTGMYVNRDNTNILTANNEGVNAINLTARQYLTIGNNSRFEDYGEDRTACFWIGG